MKAGQVLAEIEAPELDQQNSDKLDLQCLPHLRWNGDLAFTGQGGSGHGRGREERICLTIK